jgi:hypothetical protein
MAPVYGTIERPRRLRLRSGRQTGTDPAGQGRIRGQIKILNGGFRLDVVTTSCRPARQRGPVFEQGLDRGYCEEAGPAGPAGSPGGVWRPLPARRLRYRGLSANEATDRQIMRQTGHKSRAMIDRYSREDRKDRQIAASKLGL